MLGTGTEFPLQGRSADGEDNPRAVVVGNPSAQSDPGGAAADPPRHPPNPRPRVAENKLLGRGDDRGWRRASASDVVARGNERSDRPNGSSGMNRAQTTHGGLVDLGEEGRLVVVGGGTSGEEYFRLGSAKGTVLRFPPPISRQPRASESLIHFASACSSLMFSRPSSASGGAGSGSKTESRGGLAAARAERQAAEAEARQALAKAEPNLFPEICMPPTGNGGAGQIRGRRGWLTSD